MHQIGMAFRILSDVRNSCNVSAEVKHVYGIILLIKASKT